jgi:hypothetical protein
MSVRKEFGMFKPALFLTVYLIALAFPALAKPPEQQLLATVQGMELVSTSSEGTFFRLLDIAKPLEQYENEMVASGLIKSNPEEIDCVTLDTAPDCKLLVKVKSEEEIAATKAEIAELRVLSNDLKVAVMVNLTYGGTMFSGETFYFVPDSDGRTRKQLADALVSTSLLKSPPDIRRNPEPNGHMTIFVRVKN